MPWNNVLWVGIALVALGASLAYREHCWLREARVVPGEIVAMVASRGRKGGIIYRPLIRFTVLDGSTHEFVHGGFRTAGSPGFFVGQGVTVAYDARSFEARLLIFDPRFGAAVFLTVLGLAAITLAIVFLVGQREIPRIYVERSTKV